MRTSVVIPTYNRSDFLGRALRGLLDQSLKPGDYEIIVVDDGSADATPQAVKDLSLPESRLRYLRQENKGPAAARNLGVSEARGDIILFTGDDCLPDSRLLEEHSLAHQQEGDVGVIGHVAWHPELKITPFMLFLEEGVQFGFRHIKDPERAPYWAFYTSNCSIRKRRLEEVGGFDEDFKHAAWEDIELAYRLTQRGLRLLYRPSAITYHHHATTLEHYMQRQRLAGRAAALTWQKHPELREELGVAHAARIVAVHQFYEGVLGYAFSVGVRDALRDTAAPTEDELEAPSADPALAAAGRAWVHEVLGQELDELYLCRRDLHNLRTQWDRVTSRRLYRWSESLARFGWRVLKPLGLVRRKSA